MNAERVRAVKARHVEHAHKDLDSQSQAQGGRLHPLEIAAKKEAVRPPLAAFSDGYQVSFIGEDAARAAGVLGLAASDPLVIDSRDWNDAVARLEAAGLTVAISDA